MITVKLYDRDPNIIIAIVHELRELGWVQGIDFNFAYKAALYNNDGYEQIYPKHTEFTFYTDSLATFFSLKYAN